MTDAPDHVKEFDPNAPEPAAEAEAPKPIRTPPMVLNEFFQALVDHLGQHPRLQALLDEFLAMTLPPSPPPPTA